MARTSQTPTGRASKSEFDELLRSEIARSRGRGGETDTQAARDRVAKRLNAQEGRGTSSSAYRPARPAAQGKRGGGSSRGSGRGTSGGDGGGGGAQAADVPVPKPRPGAGHPPNPTVGTPDETSSVPWWLLPLLASSKRGRMLMAEGFNPAEFQSPNPRPTVIPPERMPIVIDNADYGTTAMPAIGATAAAPALPYHPSVAAPIDELMTEGDVGRFMTNEELARAQAGAAPLRTMEEGIAGEGTAGGGGLAKKPSAQGWKRPLYKAFP